MLSFCLPQCLLVRLLHVICLDMKICDVTGGPRAVPRDNLSLSPAIHEAENAHLLSDSLNDTKQHQPRHLLCLPDHTLLP